MTTTTDWPALLEALSEPFPAELVSWRAGAVSRDKKRAQALPYAEPRAYEDRLNAVCPGDWSVLFKPWGEHKLICELTIHGVTRSSTGEYEENARGAIAQGTVAEAQAFKRACSKFGLGRYLYDIPLAWVDYDDEKKRLVETPELPGRFLPPRPAQAASERQRESMSERQREASQPRQPAQRQEESEARGASPLLSAERAKAMGVELEKLGFNRREQLRLASSVLGRSVSSLEKLSEAEALEVWSSAKQPARRAA